MARVGILTVGGIPLVDADGRYLGAVDSDHGLISGTPAVVAFARADENAYFSLIDALLPSGWAWPRGDSNLMRFVRPIADGFARIHRNILRFLALETDPTSATDMLLDWERAFGLPDDCSAEDELTIEQRRYILLERVTGKGGQTRAFLIALASAHGYSVTIDEFREITCIDPCTSHVFGRDWPYAFRVNAAEETINVATCVAFCTSPLRTWGNERLECVIREAAPAHTIPIFTYL